MPQNAIHILNIICIKLVTLHERKKLKKLKFSLFNSGFSKKKLKFGLFEIFKFKKPKT